MYVCMYVPMRHELYVRNKIAQTVMRHELWHKDIIMLFIILLKLFSI